MTALNVSFKISSLSPRDKRKIYTPALFPPFAQVFFYFLLFFPSTLLFIYFGAYENLLRWMEISIHFQFLNCWLKFPLISKIFPEPRSHIWTFSAPLPLSTLLKALHFSKKFLCYIRWYCIPYLLFLLLFTVWPKQYLSVCLFLISTVSFCGQIKIYPVCQKFVHIVSERFY